MRLMSTIAEARYSTVAKPWLKVLADLILSTSPAGMGSPVSVCRAKFDSSSGVGSQCSFSWLGSSTKSRTTPVPASDG